MKGADLTAATTRAPVPLPPSFAHEAPRKITEEEREFEAYRTLRNEWANAKHEGKRKAESLWPIMRISHTRSRYIYELYYKREAISRELYDWLLKEGYADAK